ncbi:18S rRNA biogenesis protein [Sistotremastrum niveocremeum HHB9708]|uniref:18S rRNA biogenesis protein n=1 Tax=Sistotremastrum niveocremeum HHB9708 TaxID=1314777 RepID=A0A164N913_9AGAM|nr:18S rRNA biogenesis protein [Sistotremastrum niveocremeum HHB9708]
MPTASSTTVLVKYTGHRYFRNRLILSLLSGKPVRIDGIRSNDKNPGLRDYEASFLRLVEKITNGSVIEISYTGTSVLLKPGVISGGDISHDCPLSRSIGYFLEPMVAIAPFAKTKVHLTLKGITTDDKDLSADLIRTVTLTHLQLFNISDGLELRIKKRGAAPLGGGEVHFLCPVVRQIKTLNFVDAGKIKRIRGISHSVRVSPQFSNRMIEACRSVLNRYIPDIYLYSDVFKGEESGKSPGYALSLVAESTTGALHCSESVSEPGGSPEDTALRASRALLSEITRGGCIDRHCQSLVMLYMTLGSEDVGRCKMGELSPTAVQTLRDIRDFFGTTFKIVPDTEPPSIDDEGSELTGPQLLLSCYGTGFINVNRSIA